MQKTFLWICLAGYLLLLAGGSEVRGQKLSTIAVMDLESIGVEQYLGQAVAENLRTALINTGAFNVVERSRLKKILREQQLQLSGMIDRESAVKVGQLLGANIFVLGSVTRMGVNYTINVRFIDVQTGLSIGAKKVTGKSESELPQMIDKIVDGLMGKEGQQPVVERKKPLGAVPSGTLAPKKSAKAACLSYCLGPGTGEWLSNDASFSSCLLEHLFAWGISSVLSYGLYAITGSSARAGQIGSAFTILVTVGSILDAYNNSPEEQERINLLFTTIDL